MICKTEKNLKIYGLCEAFKDIKLHIIFINFDPHSLKLCIIRKL